MFRHCKVLPVFNQFKYTLLKENFYNETIRNPIQHPVYTRAVAQNRLCTTRANNRYGERTASYIVPRLINRLPPELINNITPRNLKHKLKEYFLNIDDLMHLPGFELKV